MRVLPSLLAVCLLAGCGQGEMLEPAETPADVATQGVAEEAAAAAEPALDVAPAADDVLDVAENPLVGLLEQDMPYGESEAGNLIGFLAVPEDAAEPLPGIILLHEWWGLTEGVKEVARRLARERYVVLAADLFGGNTADSVDAARELMRGIVESPDAARDNIRQAFEYLELYALAPRIASVGWDLGGRWALQSAIMMPDELDAVVMFYGAVEDNEALLEPLDMPILALFGEQDSSIPLRNVQQFRNALAQLGKQAEVRIYSGVDHGFFFPSDMNYSPIAADDAWIRMVALLDSALREESAAE